MSTQPETNTALDAVRFFYLARVAERQGDRETARRWYAKAKEWMEHAGIGEPKPGAL